MSWCIHLWDAVALLSVVACKALRELSPSSDCNRDLHSLETPNFLRIADLGVRYYLRAVDWTLLCSVLSASGVDCGGMWGGCDGQKELEDLVLKQTRICSCNGL